MATKTTFVRGQTKIGLSLSGCIAEMVKLRYQDDDIEVIYTSVSFSSPEEFEKILSEYARSSWKRFSEEACSIARRMYQQGKIKPNPLGIRSIDISHGFWCEVEKDIVGSEY